MSSTLPQNFSTPLLLEDYTAVTPPVTPDSPPLCAICHSTDSLRRCSTCKSLYYCSPTCQARDWGIHKPLCKPFGSPSDSKKPDKSYRRALYLPETNDKPRFAWIKFDNDGRPLDMAKCFPNSGADQIKTIAFHERHLPYWVQISYDSNASGRSLTTNACVEWLLSKPSATTGLENRGTDTRKHTVWRGPLVVLGYSAEDGLSKPALDIDPSVLGPVVQYLALRSEYEGPAFFEQPQKRYSEQEWKDLSGGKQ